MGSYNNMQINLADRGTLDKLLLWSVISDASAEWSGVYWFLYIVKHPRDSNSIDLFLLFFKTMNVHALSCFNILRDKDKMDGMPVDLLGAFTSFNDNRNVLEKLKGILLHADPVVGLLALEGLYRIENDVESGQFVNPDTIRVLLRRWRLESPLNGAYTGAYKRVPNFLRSLTIFETLEVPLFIDNWGQKELLGTYQETDYIQIDGNTPIFHDTHSPEAQSISKERQFRPSANKNIIKGCWFGLGSSNSSVYGSKRFQTTLSQLGVTGLHQGEIVSYTNEVNVILYAGNDTDTDFTGLKKPVDAAVRAAHNTDAYVKVSIFVPARFLPSQENFRQVVSGPLDVQHNTFCVKEKRSHKPCKELQLGREQAMVDQFQDL